MESGKEATLPKVDETDAAKGSLFPHKQTFSDGPISSMPKDPPRSLKEASATVDEIGDVNKGNRSSSATPPKRNEENASFSDVPTSSIPKEDSGHVPPRSIKEATAAVDEIDDIKNGNGSSVATLPKVDEEDASMGPLLMHKQSFRDVPIYSIPKEDCGHVPPRSIKEATAAVDEIEDIKNGNGSSFAFLPNVDEEDASMGPLFMHKQSFSDVPISSIPKEDRSHLPPRLSADVALSTEFLPVHMMETPEHTTCRIPSHVFDSSKSSSPGDWSVASNESLFSIHMGNMSFTKDYLMFRSGELGLQPGETCKSGQMFNYSATRGSEANFKCGEFGAAEAAVETMKEVLRECEENQAQDVSTRDGVISHHPEGSRTNTTSFAFSATDKTGSSKAGQLPKIDPEKQQSKDSQPHAESESKNPQNTAPIVCRNRWFSQWWCCSFCF